MCLSQKKAFFFLTASSFVFYTPKMELPMSVESLRLLGTVTMMIDTVPSNYEEGNRTCNSPSHLFFFHLYMLTVKKLQKVFLDFQLVVLSSNSMVQE